MNKIITLVAKTYEKYQEIINYIIVGGLTTLVSLFIFYGSTLTFLDGNNSLQLQIANIISWIGSVAFAYYANRKYVFKSKNSQILKEICSFVSSRVLTLLLDMGTMFILASVLLINYNIAKIIAMLLVTIGNYIISKIFVFKKSNA